MAVVRAHDGPALAERQGRHELFPRIGPDVSHAVREGPLELGSPGQKDPAKDQPRDAVGMPLGIRDAERRTPRAAEHEPLLDPEMGPDALGVLHEIPRRVLAQLAERRRLSRPALVEEDDPPESGVEKAAVERRDAGPGTAVKKDDRRTGRISRLLDVQLVDLRNAQARGAIRLEVRKKCSHPRIMSEKESDHSDASRLPQTARPRPT